MLLNCSVYDYFANSQTLDNIENNHTTIILFIYTELQTNYKKSKILIIFFLSVEEWNSSRSAHNTSISQTVYEIKLGDTERT